MRRCLTALMLLVALPVGAVGKERGVKEAASQAVGVVKAETLPLALNDRFEVVKIFAEVIDPKRNARAVSTYQKAEIDRRYYGAINQFERRQREGNYYTVRWKAPRGTAVTVRLEYRQKNLGRHVQAMEVRYPEVLGEMRTEFSVLGDDYYEDGAVVAWRVLLIEAGQIVGLQQSFLW